jgi:ABC-type glycerol-3-phosphate transport system substrate-binding protein
VSSVASAVSHAKQSSISMLVSDFMFNSPQYTEKYAKLITAEWDAKYPSVKLNVIQIGGTDVNEADSRPSLQASIDDA